MFRTVGVIAGLWLVTACGPRTPREGSASCGLTMIAAANLVLQQTGQTYRFSREVPPGLDGVVPARVVGYETSAADIAPGDSGSVVGAYRGRGFPAIPGFGLALVDDSSEVFRGILIFEPEPPGRTYPSIGTLHGENSQIPLYALRVHWSSVNDPTCPLFWPPDTAAAVN